MPAALYYHPEAYSISGPRLMGRHAAGASFLRAYLDHSHHDAWWVQVQSPQHSALFSQEVHARTRPDQPPQRVHTVTNDNLADLAQPGTVFHPDPCLGPQAWRRAAYGHGRWSLCGITHTTAAAGSMDALVELLVAPVQPWDALICTSHAAKGHVTQLLQAQADHLAARLGIRQVVLPQLPVIPLGVHTQDFAFTPAQRAQARQALGVDAATRVVLFMGRLSFHAKAHPLAMYQALQAAADHTGQPVVLVECGWHGNEPIARAYADAARLACPGVRVITLDGRVAAQRQIAWAGADVFCSLSDNLQETFGITPIEAMAAGLPVVVSDWDGYKDTVRDGVDGFRVPTLMAPAGLGADLALRHALEVDTYDMYCGQTCSLVAVDVPAAAQALARLLASPALCRQMGEAGRQRARQVYDWAAILPRYEALWAHLGELRQAQAPALPALAHPWPARMEPFAAFAGYPSQSLSPQTPLALVDRDADTAQRRALAYRQLAMVDFAHQVLITDDEIRAVLGRGTTAPRAAADWVADVPAPRQLQAYRALVWLVKLGVLRVA